MKTHNVKVKFWEGIFEYLTTTKTRKLGIPISAYLEITDRCNFRCVHCHAVRLPQKKLMTYAEICSVIDQLAEIGTFAIVMTGGEPLLREDFWKILEYAKKKQFAIRLNTNASLITNSIARRLADLFLYDICVSIYGMDEYTYRSVTGVSGIFKKILKNIALLTRNKVPVTLRVPLLYRNINQIKAYKDFAKRIGASVEYIIDINPKFNQCQEPLRHVPSDIQLEDFFRLSFNPARDKKDLLPHPSDYICPGGLDKLAISAYGEVMPCIYLRNNADIRGGSLIDIIRKNHFFKYIGGLKWGDLQKCINCEALMYCSPCPGKFFLETGSFVVPPPTLCRRAWLKKKLCDKKLKS